MNASKRMLAVAGFKRISDQRVVTPIASNIVSSLSSIRSFQSSCSLRTKATQNSWAVEWLEERGEKIPQGEQIPPTQLTDEVLYNPSPKVLKLADEYLACNVIQSTQVWRAIQGRLGFSMEELFAGGGNMGGGGGGAAAAAAPEPVKEKEAFDLKLTEVPAAAKIKVIKEVRAITGLGLKEAKDMVEGAPIMVKQGLKKEEAEKLMKAIVDAGGKAELL